MTEPAYNLSVCSICGLPALFTEADPGANPVSYCTGDLPAHLAPRAAAGQLPLRSSAPKAALLEQAKELDIDGRTTMSKGELEVAVAAAAAEEATDELIERRPTFEEVEKQRLSRPGQGEPKEQDAPEADAPPPKKRAAKR